MCRKSICIACFVFMMGLATTVAEAADPSLFGYWKFDEGSGTTAYDSSGNGFDGTLVGGVTWVAGRFGGAVQLDGSSGYISVPNFELTTDTITFVAWLNGWRGGDWAPLLSSRAVNACEMNFGDNNTLHYTWNNDSSATWSWTGGPVIPQDTWTMLAVTIAPDKAVAYVYTDAAGLTQSTNPIAHIVQTVGALQIGYSYDPRYIRGIMDEAAIFDRALTEDEIMALVTGIGGGYPYAATPNPADGAVHADTWVNLSWRAGDFAVSHDVYLGESFEDVDIGTGDTFRGNQASTFYVAGFPGFAYPDGLVPGTTYYWRIDEVNDAEPNSPWKGDVWSFSIPPKKAYNPRPADGAEGVALDAKLTWTGGFGAKLHYVHFGESFEEVDSAAGGLPQGTTTYSPGALRFAKTYYWRVDEFDAIQTHKGDVWSFTTAGAVGGPNPANGAVDVDAATTITWNAGALAASHEVYFGADLDTVKSATKASPEYKGAQALGDESYDPGTLLFDTAYYWRIDEVNSTHPESPWVGNVWSFTTGSYFAVDDFESYNDIEPPDPASNRIFDNWIDGFGTTNNGALVGNDLPPYAEQTIVHGGSQSMPFRYDNNLKSSEATLTLASLRDWTEQGVAELSLWFRGNPASVGSFVEGPVGTYTMTAAGADIWNQADEFHFAYKMLTGIGSIEAKVESVQNTNAWAKAGVMIRETLDPGSKFAGVYITPTAADGSATNGCRFQARTDTGVAATADDASASSQQMAIIAPYWIKLERDMSGNFRGYHSNNGTTWQAMTWNPQYITMASNVYVGLALTSHSAGVTCEAKFSGVKTTGTTSPQWAHQDIGIASNAAEPLYVAVSNSAGAAAVVYHDDANAATIETWTPWVIPLQAFADQGINLTNVDRIALGMGTKGNTAAGGTGTMYFDDIQLRTPAIAP